MFSKKNRFGNGHLALRANANGKFGSASFERDGVLAANRNDARERQTFRINGQLW